MGNKEKEFNTILDECLDRVIFNGETPEQCLASYPEFADELSPLLDTAIITEPIHEIEPRPEFKNRARNEFMAYLNEAEAQRKPSLFSFEWVSWHRRLATGMALVIAVIAATGGTAAASMDSMPDDFLYPVKRATENVQLAFTFTSIGKAEVYARMADNRVEEIVYMAGLNDGEEIELLASSLNSNLMNIAAISSRDENSAMIAEESAQGSMITATTADEPTMVKAFAEDSILDTGSATEGEVAGAAIPERDASDTSENEEVADMEILATQGDSILTMDGNISATEVPAPTLAWDEGAATDEEIDPMMVLNSAIIDQASSNLASLYELLDIVPESLKPTIERAIRLSEQGYEIAINSLQP